MYGDLDFADIFFSIVAAILRTSYAHIYIYIYDKYTDVCGFLITDHANSSPLCCSRSCCDLASAIHADRGIDVCLDVLVEGRTSTTRPCKVKEKRKQSFGSATRRERKKGDLKPDLTERSECPPFFAGLLRVLEC